MKDQPTNQAPASEGTREGPCWPLPLEWDTLIPPQAVEIVHGTYDHYRTTFSKPQWNATWLRGLEAYVRSIVRDELSKANAGSHRQEEG